MSATDARGRLARTGRDALAAYLDGPPPAVAVPTGAAELDRPGPPADAPLGVWLTGTGTPAVLAHRAGPSTVVRAGSDVLLVDCGNATAYQLVRIGIQPREVTHLFLTHHHLDHNVGLGFLLMSPWITGRGGEHRPPVVIGPPGTVEFVNRTLALHAYDMLVRVPHGYRPELLCPRVVEVADGTGLAGAAWTATAFRVEHQPVCQAFGYRFDGARDSLAISGDTRPYDNLVEHARGVDLLVHEALYPGFGFPEYHTLSTDVGKVAARCRAQRLALTHLLPGDRPDRDWDEHARAHFDGPIVVGRDLLQVMGADGP